MAVNLTSAVAGGYSGYSIDNSMLFDDGSSQYLSRTFSTPTDNNVWTLSMWFKPGAIDTGLRTLVGTNSGTIDRIQFGSTAYKLSYSHNAGAANITFDDVFRDPSAFYHVVISVNTDASGGSRVRGWKNGVEMTSTGSEPGSGAATGINSAVQHNIGRDNGSQYFDGYIAEVHFLDGTAVSDPNDFGEFWSGNDKAWRPKAVSGLTYGTNGFYLPCSGTIGHDESGNENDWVNNNSVSQSSDSPTVNYATLNPLTAESPNISNGNLDLTMNTKESAHSTIAIDSGQWYYEVTVGGNNWAFCLSNNPNERTGIAVGSTTCIIRSGDGATANNCTVDSDTFSSSSANDVMGFAIDLDALTVDVYQNNSLVAEFSAITIDGPFFIGADRYTSSSTPTHSFNFGQSAFAYTPPAGYKALAAANLPDPTITDPGEHFNAVLHTGTGAEQAVTGAGFQPDFTWIKNRDQADSHMLFDVIRGATEVLHSNETAAEATEAQTLKSFDSDGFTLGTDVQVNTSSEDYVSWNWLADNTSGSSNTDGSIQSAVAVNDDAGFSIVKLASADATGASATLGHGQTAAPELIIGRPYSTTSSWPVYHKDNTAAPETDRLLLDTSGATVDDNRYWDDVAPTASVFSVNSLSNMSSQDSIFYCFRSIPGYSKCGTFEGNGNADGSFVWLGFKPAFLLIKSVDSTSSWHMYDDLREGYNVDNDRLSADSNSAEGTADEIDLLSNGFKCRIATDPNVAETYIYYAVARNPLGGSNVPLGLAV